MAGCAISRKIVILVGNSVLASKFPKKVPKTLRNFKNFMNPFYGCGSTVSRLQSHYKEIVYFLPVSSQKFLVLIWSTSEEWKGELSQPWSHPVVLNTGPLDWESSTLTESITLSIKWIHNLLRSLDWIKQKGTTAKREMNPALYDKLVFTKRKKYLNIKFLAI